MSSHLQKYWNLTFFSFKIRIGDQNLKLNISESSGKILDVKELYMHPLFDGSTSYYDVAILKTEPVEFSRVGLSLIF